MHLRLKEKYDRLREDCRCEQKDRTIRKLSEQLEEVPALLSLVDQLQRMVFGRRTEKSRVRCKPQVGAGNDSEDASKKTRGQRKGSKGPGRTRRRVRFWMIARILSERTRAHAAAGFAVRGGVSRCCG